MKKFVALLLAVLMVASLCACGQKDTQTGSDIKTVTAGKLTMSTNAQFPPYESVADDGKGYEGTGFEGIDIEIAYALAQKLGLELVVDDMDFDSALSAVQTGKSDIVAAGVTVTPERQNTMCFTDSYANGVQVVIVKEGSDIKSIDDLEGKKIGTQRGTTGYSYCIDDYGEDSVVPFDDGATAVQNLLAGKVDCVVIDKAPAQEYVKANAGLTILDTEYVTESYAIGAQGIDAINEAYPVPPLENVDANFQAIAAATPDFTAVCDGQPAACCANISLYNANSQSFSDVESLPPQGSAYIVLMLMVPKDWKQLKVTYVPTFLEGKSLTFVMNASDVIRS